MIEKEIIIVGAGPSGLLLALNLARAGIKVRILEAATEPDRQPRAILYGPAAVRELRRAGVLDAMARRGSRVPSGVSWRAPGDAALLAQMPKPPPPPPGAPPGAATDGAVSLSLSLMVEILLEAVQAEPHAVIEYGWRVLDVGQDDTCAWVQCTTAGAAGAAADASAASSSSLLLSSSSSSDASTTTTTSSSSSNTLGSMGQEHHSSMRRVEGAYVVGCDGSSSTVRASLFGKEFPGFTWDPWLMASNVKFHDEDAFYNQAGLCDINFFLHPTDWCFIARIGAPEPLWRVTYGDDGALAREDVSHPERVLQRLQKVLPHALSSSSSSSSSPAPQFEVVNSSPYRAHQRCAPRFRVGRVLLAADAAHLCNPFGGMGLTNGIVDVGGLSDCLVGLHRGVATEEILDKYDVVRRGIYHDVVDKITTANFQRVMQDAEEARTSDPTLVACREAENDPEMAAKVVAMMRAPALLKHDFTQYYTT